MGFSQHAETFYDRKIIQFENEDCWEGPEHAYRIGVTYDDNVGSLRTLLHALLGSPGADKLQALVIGAWQGDDTTSSSAPIIEELCNSRGRLPDLRALFLGDITYEENEISWIEQSDVTPLLAAFATLEILRVRGGNGLKFSRSHHAKLRTLIVEAGGLNRSVLREISRCEFPALEHLELWLGVANYGWDGGVEDLQPILSGKLFPSLKYLGLRNSEIADEIAPVVVNAPILERLTTLDLSNGTLSDVGGQALLNLPADTRLTTLNLSHHYMSDAMVDRLALELPCEVIAEDGQDPDEEWRSVVASE